VSRAQAQDGAGRGAAAAVKMPHYATSLGFLVGGRGGSGWASRTGTAS